jgi:hypothetical protein
VLQLIGACPERGEPGAQIVDPCREAVLVGRNEGGQWATDSANDAASRKITSTGVIRVVVDARYTGAPDRRRMPVNGCTPMTRMSASRTDAMISVNCRSAGTLTGGRLR